MLVERWLARAAARRPAHTALETPDASVSYAELLGAASAGARELADMGARPGARVAIALGPGLAFAHALHSCLLLGAAAVPVDVRLSQPERDALTHGADVVIEEPLASVQGEGARAAPAPPGGHDLDAVALVMHTSGTGGAPRPVELTHGNLLWSALGSAAALGVDARDRWLCTLPVSHVGGISILLRSAIYATTAVVHERFERGRALAALREQRITLVSVVATTLARLLESGLEAPEHLRCALTGGGPVPAPLLERAHRARVPVGITYGLTEACSQVSTTPLAEIGGAPAGPGPPLFCTRVRIAADGEILVRGPTVAPGAPADDGWLHTGDLGSVDERGRVRVTGRRDETIVSGGENVAPAEVEAALEACDGVLEAAVLGSADEEWGEAVTAIVVTAPGAALEAEELRRRCAARLAPYKVPKRIELRSEPLPRTASGKLLRRELA
jgi:o-succinylbenzoate---CoA ligase